MIASEAFHKLPRLKDYGTYPSDSIFDVFRVSYQECLSEMNAEGKFYYSNTTNTKPKDVSRLGHVAGVGSSPVVQYEGYGAYFLDQLENGVWRLEVMPDAIPVRDPFAKASPEKEVTRIQWQTQPMEIILPDLGKGFSVKGLNEGNNYEVIASGGNFKITPGAYLLVRKGETGRNWNENRHYYGRLQLNEFVAPEPFNTEPYVVHDPYKAVSGNKPFTIHTKIVGIDSSAEISLLIHNFSGVYKTIPMERVTAYDYEAIVPEELATPGLINYRVMIQKANDEYITFPGSHAGNPYAWDYYANESWQTFVASENGALELFNARDDRDIHIYPNVWGSYGRQLAASEKPGQFILKFTVEELPDEDVIGWQHYFADKLKGRQSELASFDKLVLRARTGNENPVQLKVVLITRDAASFASYITLDNELQNIEIPLNTFRLDSMILLPRPYPGFQPFWFKADVTKALDLEGVEKIQIILIPEKKPSEDSYSFEVETIQLRKMK